MALTTEAWVLHPGPGADGVHADLRREAFEFSAPTEEEALVRPLFGCWEGNMGHAIERKPVDLCLQRKEPKVVMGNAGVVEVLSVGSRVTTVKPGDKAIVFCNGIWDEFGYPKRIFGFDAPGTIGVLARQTKLHQHQLIPIPAENRYDLKRWAAFSLRYVTAWSNWRLAFGMLRLQLNENELPEPFVFGWGGGVTLAELHLARLQGCRTYQISTEERREAAEKLGIHGIDRTRFPHLNYDEERYKTDKEFRERYKASEELFLDEVRRLTEGRGVHIFLDYVGSPVIRATLKALSREGVVATAGWKEGMQLWFLRAIECIERHQFVHTHYARYSEGVQAVRFALANEWLPEVDERVYSFDEIPQLATDYLGGDFTYFPIFEVNPL
jgi:NADPH:quinone reductase-like Zn-dependent oxidoreductase